MQKLPEVPYRKYGRRMRKEKEMSWQKKETRSLQQRLLGWKHLYLSCCWWKATCPFYTARWLTFPLVAAVFVTNNPWLKTPNDGLIKPRLKNTEFWHINSEFQCLIWQKQRFSNSPGSHFLTTEFVRKSHMK